MKNNLFVFSLLVVLAVISRFLPHPYNFSPLGALALFGGAFASQKRWAVVLPLVALLLSDVFIGLHSTMFFVYGAYAAIALIGWRLRKNQGMGRLVGASLSASLVFFVFSNLGVWLMTGMYAKTLSGLVACYVAAVPFFHQTLAGDLLYTTALFGAYSLLVNMRKPALLAS